jgi:hypothetical protein
MKDDNNYIHLIQGKSLNAYFLMIKVHVIRLLEFT